MELALGLKCVKCGEPAKTKPEQHYHVGVFPIHLKSALRWSDGTIQAPYLTHDWAYCDECYHDEQEIHNRILGIH